MAHMKGKGKHTGVTLGKEFLMSLNMYNITSDMIGSITQDNAGNCKTLKAYLVNVEELGFHEDQFLWCFLHILNLACQAAIEVYDPSRKNKQKVQLVTDNGELSEDGSEDSDDPDDRDYKDKEEYDNDDLGQDAAYTQEVQDVETKSNVIEKVVFLI